MSNSIYIDKLILNDFYEGCVISAVIHFNGAVYRTNPKPINIKYLKSESHFAKIHLIGFIKQKIRCDEKVLVILL
jgi:hypothetical protein